MNNKKYSSLIGVFFMILYSIYSLTKSINSEVTIKIIASLIGMIGFIGMFIFFYLKIRKQEVINKKLQS